MPQSLDNLASTSRVQNPARPTVQGETENDVWVRRPPRHGFGIRRNVNWNRVERPSRSRPGIRFRSQRGKN